MSAFRFVLCVAVVVMGLSNVQALDKEAIGKILEQLMPVIAKCSDEYGLDDGAVTNLHKKDDFDGIDKCFFACVYKKIGFLNDKGEVDTDKVDELAKKYLTSEEDLKNADNLTEDCSKVNDEDVSDGDAGCERALLLTNCIFKHKELIKSSIP